MLEKLRTIRENSSLTIVDMAKRLGISKQYYSQLERGERRLSYDMAVDIAMVFNMTPDDIFLPVEYAKCVQENFSSVTIKNVDYHHRSPPRAAI
ncbi:helix-turn-helix transcriptional regulator [Heliobacterium mobile]|uniref:helix-turn-helix transcriptional regulator n=1 Tax=Heliobacterium mobile TaxID=28064 RepID=UPI0012D7D54E|nr:helix-turn-helix transcriptional regulator [Heliobacterium mobile]